MKHLEHEQLWSFARGELPPDEAQAATTHLTECPDCRVTLEDVKGAQAALFALPPPPPMPDAMARRVGQQLAELADAEAAKRFVPWWHGLFTFRLALVAALAVALVGAGAWLVRSDTSTVPPAPVARPTPAPLPSPPPVPSTAPKLSVVVASAKNATASKRQVLQEGAKVSTAAGGSLWMKLPDGSRAGLTGTSEVTLATLEAKQLTLDLGRGSLALEVPHREDRVLTVRAGDLEVKDLGTRFLVSRHGDKTLVAVEEGVVEVKTPTGTRELRAGRAVTWRQGQLQELPWEAPSAPVTPAAATPTPSVDPGTPDIPPADAQPSSVARLDEDDDGDLPPPPEEVTTATPPPPDRTPVAADEQWAPPPPPGQPAGAPPVAIVSRKPMRRGFSLRELERRLVELGQVLTTPPDGEREAQARTITHFADAKDCEHAVALADRWLRAPPSALPNEAQLRRGVQVQKLRCLVDLGRTDEATALQRALQTSP